MAKLSFSGHESFQCRNLWLKKGYEFNNGDLGFNHDLAVVSLGVGKNMVTSIKFWLKAFNLINSDDENTNLAVELFDEEHGFDRYLEDIGTLWLLHYQLVKTKKAYIYNYFFNHFRRTRVEFTKEHLLNSLLIECRNNDESHSKNTIETDIGVLLKNYLKPQLSNKVTDIEDTYSSLLIDLDLIELIHVRDSKSEWYKCLNKPRPTLPTEIVLYTIIENQQFSNSISFNDLLNEENSPGSIFAIDADELLRLIHDMTDKYDWITYTDDAGVRVLQLHKEHDGIEVLRDYYAN